MSRRSRTNAATTYVNNVRGPTSALTSFLNERGIRRANPAPAPPPVATPPEEAETTQTANGDGSPSSSSTRLTRTARLTRGRTLPNASQSSSRSNDANGANDDSGSDSEDSDDSESDSNKNLIPIAVSASTARAVRTTRSRVSTAASSSSATSSSATSSSATSSSATSSTVKAKASTAMSKKRPRKKGESDESSEEGFQDITGHISRSGFSHKGRMPQGSNKIVFCSRCRARFTIKAGTTAAVDDDGGLLCPTCAGAGSSASSKDNLPKAKTVKRARRKAQKAEIECHIPTLQDLCIQKIANCIEDVEAFGDISDISLDKICKIICRNRSLNPDTLQLFLDPRHSDLTLYDCTDITAAGLQNIAQFCPNLRSLKLKLCGRITNEVMDYYIEHLTKLTALTLIGPILILDHTYIKLFETVGQRFEKFELKGSSRLSSRAIQTLCENCPNITHLRLGDCNLMDDDWLEPISSLTKLTSLRIRGPEPGKITTPAVVKLILAVGSGLEELELKNCADLTDEVLVDAIRPSCVRVERLNLCGCEELTTEGVETLFKDWSVNRGLTYLNLENCVMLKDEAFIAAVTHSGDRLEELNISGLDEITKDALKSLTQCVNLTDLNVSWCRAMDDDIMERLLEAAPRLAKVTVWGDHRLTECCSSRKGLKIVGRETDHVDLRFL